MYVYLKYLVFFTTLKKGPLDLQPAYRFRFTTKKNGPVTSCPMGLFASIFDSCKSSAFYPIKKKTSSSTYIYFSPSKKKEGLLTLCPMGLFAFISGTYTSNHFEPKT